MMTAARSYADWVRDCFGLEWEVVSDREALSKGTGKHLVVFGNPSLHSVHRTLNDDLPIKFDGAAIHFGDEYIVDERARAAFITPNPTDPSKYVLVFACPDVRLLRDFDAAFDTLDDFVVVRGTLKASGGFFDKSGSRWKVSPSSTRDYEPDFERYDSAHFVFWYRADSPCAAQLESAANHHEESLARICETLGVEPPERKIDYYLFSSNEEKGIHTGSKRDVHAWREGPAVYVVEAVLLSCHEDAHVVADGVAPQDEIPLLAEGFAVQSDTEDVHEAAIAPASERGPVPVQSLATAEGFTRADAATASAVAGSFTRYLIQSRGIPKFRDCYRRASAAPLEEAFRAAYGEDMAEVANEWEKYLEGLGGAPLTCSLRDAFRVGMKPGAVAIYGSGGTPEEQALLLEAANRSGMGKVPVVVKRDRDVTGRDLEGHIILVGNPSNNSVYRKVNPMLPVRLDGDAFRAAGREWRDPDGTLVMVHPNPFNSRKYMVIMGFAGVYASRRTPALPPDADFQIGLSTGVVIRGAFRKDRRGWTLDWDPIEQYPPFNTFESADEVIHYLPHSVVETQLPRIRFQRLRMIPLLKSVFPGTRLEKFHLYLFDNAGQMAFYTGVADVAWTSPISWSAGACVSPTYDLYDGMPEASIALESAAGAPVDGGLRRAFSSWVEARTANKSLGDRVKAASDLGRLRPLVDAWSDDSPEAVEQRASFVGYLVERRGAQAFLAFARASGSRAARDAFKGAYGVEIEEVERAWLESLGLQRGVSSTP
jgi:hypothetical protein